ncbi:GerMN domain-containing protein [Selenomonas sp.]|uniref:GerMN domain-containing protein n=1 Tax=Selenomonas sp. TaxID=2053611 RepID=UPI0025E12B2A|nr:GerMN domain-containing protein [Selenomonas sp.]MCI6284550.1 GerMN domain-containing protein [Selenomonas sp.]
MKNWLRVLPALFLISLLVFAAGCGTQAPGGAPSSSSTAASSSSGSADAQAASSSAAKKASDVQTLTVNVYYPNEQGTKLLPSSRKIETGSSKDKYTAALESLMKGPTEKGQTAIFPKKAKLLSVTLKNGTAVVNFSKELQTNFVGGSTGEEMLVGSIVNTLTEFSEVKNVHILIDGKNIETLSGHMDLSVPISRMTNVL